MSRLVDILKSLAVGYVVLLVVSVTLGAWYLYDRAMTLELLLQLVVLIITLGTLYAIGRFVRGKK